MPASQTAQTPQEFVEHILQPNDEIQARLVRERALQESCRMLTPDELAFIEQCRYIEPENRPGFLAGLVRACSPAPTATKIDAMKPCR